MLRPCRKFALTQGLMHARARAGGKIYTAYFACMRTGVHVYRWEGASLSLSRATFIGHGSLRARVALYRTGNSVGEARFALFIFSIFLSALQLTQRSAREREKEREGKYAGAFQAEEKRRGRLLLRAFVTLWAPSNDPFLPSTLQRLLQSELFFRLPLSLSLALFRVLSVRESAIFTSSRQHPVCCNVVSRSLAHPRGRDARKKGKGMRSCSSPRPCSSLSLALSFPKLDNTRSSAAE